MRNQASYYRSLGYAFSYNDTLEVRVEHLPNNSQKLLNCTCDRCDASFTRTVQNLRRKNPKIQFDGDLCYDCTRTLVGRDCDKTTNSSRCKSWIGEKHPRWNPNKSAFANYRRKVVRLTEVNYQRDIDAINPERLLRRLCGTDGGWQLDHRVSIKKGFQMGINPLWIAAKENLQMLPWKQNRDKAA